MLCLATCTTTLSWMFVLLPTSMPFTSPVCQTSWRLRTGHSHAELDILPRKTAPYQTEDLEPILTSPITLAFGAMNTPSPFLGITICFRAWIFPRGGTDAT